MYDMKLHGKIYVDHLLISRDHKIAARNGKRYKKINITLTTKQIVLNLH